MSPHRRTETIKRILRQVLILTARLETRVVRSAGWRSRALRNEDIRSNKHLLDVASKNLNLADEHLATVAWPPEVVGVGHSIRAVRLALQQTINVVQKVLDDL
jgi:hypothetical protein